MDFINYCNEMNATINRDTYFSLYLRCFVEWGITLVFIRELAVTRAQESPQGSANSSSWLRSQAGCHSCCQLSLLLASSVHVMS